jgi:hypothetical protein
MGTSMIPSQIDAVTTTAASIAVISTAPVNPPTSSLIATNFHRRGVASRVRAIVPWRNSLVTSRIPIRIARIDAGNVASRTILYWSSGSSRSSAAEPPMFPAAMSPATNSATRRNPHVERTVRSLASSAPKSRVMRRARPGRP